MTADRWRSKVAALVRLAEDQTGKPEGELARQKLQQILEKYPEARHHESFQQFMLRDLANMKQTGISTDGSWTGRNLTEAIALMVTDYLQRIERCDGCNVLIEIDEKVNNAL